MSKEQTRKSLDALTPGVAVTFTFWPQESVAVLKKKIRFVTAVVQPITNQNLVGSGKIVRVAIQAEAHSNTNWSEKQKDPDGSISTNPLTGGPTTLKSSRFWVGNHITIRFQTEAQAAALTPCCWPAHIWVNWPDDDAIMPTYATRPLGRSHNALPTIEWYSEFDLLTAQPLAVASGRTPPAVPVGVTSALIADISLDYYRECNALWISGEDKTAGGIMAQPFPGFRRVIVDNKASYALNVAESARGAP